MAEEIKNAAPDEEYNDDGLKNPDYVPPKIESEGADDTENKVETKDEGDKDEGEDAGFDDNIDPDKPPVIPVRQSTIQHILARKNETIEKLRSKTTEDEPEPEFDEEEDNLTSEAREAIGKVVNQRLAPLLGKFATDANAQEFAELVSDEPEAAKYENHIKAYMAHDAWKGVPISAIYHHLAFSNAKAIGAKKKATADLEAKQNKGGGRTIVDKGNLSGIPSAEDIANMSDEEFDQLDSKVAQGNFLGKK